MKTPKQNTSAADALPPRLILENRGLFRRRKPYLEPVADSVLSAGFWDSEPARIYRAEQLLKR